MFFLIVERVDKYCFVEKKKLTMFSCFTTSGLTI